MFQDVLQQYVPIKGTKTETTDGQIHGRGLTDESIRDAHIIYNLRFMNTSLLKIKFVSLRQ